METKKIVPLSFGGVTVEFEQDLIPIIDYFVFIHIYDFAYDYITDDVIPLIGKDGKGSKFIRFEVAYVDDKFLCSVLVFDDADFDVVSKDFFPITEIEEIFVSRFTIYAEAHKDEI